MRNLCVSLCLCVSVCLPLPPSLSLSLSLSLPACLYLLLLFVLRTWERGDLGAKVGTVEGFARGCRERSRRFCHSRLSPPRPQQDPSPQGMLLKRRRPCQLGTALRLEGRTSSLQGEGVPGHVAAGLGFPAEVLTSPVTYVDYDSKLPDASEDIVPDSWWGGKHRFKDPLALALSNPG